MADASAPKPSSSVKLVLLGEAAVGKVGYMSRNSHIVPPHRRERCGACDPATSMPEYYLTVAGISNTQGTPLLTALCSRPSFCASSTMISRKTRSLLLGVSSPCLHSPAFLERDSSPPLR